MSQSRKLLWTLLLSLAAVYTGVSAQEPRIPSSEVSVIISPVSVSDETVESIISETAEIAFSSRGLRASAGIGIAAVSGDSPGTAQRAVTAQQSPIVLLADYDLASVSATDLYLRFRIYSAEPFALLSEAGGDAVLDLSLDRSIMALLDRVVEAARVQIGEAVEHAATGASDDGGATGVAEAGATGTGDGSAAGTGDGSAAGTGDGSAAGAGDGSAAGPGVSADRGRSDDAARIPPVGPEPTPPTRAQFALGYAPPFAIGAASDYYEFAHGASGVFALYLGRGRNLAIGVAGAGAYITATGAATDGTLLIVPLAAIVGFRAIPTPVGAFLNAGGGMAMIQLTTAALGTQTDYVPYATGSVGLDIAFVRWFGMRAGITFDAVFEGSVLLTSFAPTASLTFGF